ncbi:uncharacterized protein PITG_17031 [Phytophthora infestans T30-4]|uniref:Ubiquitin-protein ligase E3A N-terminal zinc-binding domain-containing protein n=1 Tax=Phytophthora infestans (strain T30-4) TaxID=403677 RepID=D0NUM6_PHYIT|nr:uncharacterized protein PITG_17031 [Phytophthora infestans T30-4]EEY65372.1 conserved hypothetical protein [Phytophthora infestans T30-4]|eukprot:XP_002897235.1 conserved hypothetical protein [Phytophthora infestans T30-4]
MDHDQLVQAYFAMLTVGCQRDICPNSNCCSNPHTRALTATEAAIKSIYFATTTPQDLHPETPDDVPKIQALQNDTAPATPTTSSPPKSTPRRRLSVAVQLDSGLNKNRDLQVKRPTVITRVAVQPKHKPDIDPTVSPAKGARQRLLSRPKQKLFDAIKRSFSRSKKASHGST